MDFRFNQKGKQAEQCKQLQLYDTFIIVSPFSSFAYDVLLRQNSDFTHYEVHQLCFPPKRFIGKVKTLDAHFEIAWKG